MTKAANVTFINSRTCGIYKNGGPRFKTDLLTGMRTNEIDDELNSLVDQYLSGKASPAIQQVPLSLTTDRGILVPTYYDPRYNLELERLLAELHWQGITLGELLDQGAVSVRNGHGSPGNDQRTGAVPYIKVSDIRALRINVNPTNLVSESIARKYWRGDESGLEPFDLITPNRASSNIGEFAILLPGEERVVLTREVFVLRVNIASKAVWDPFVLFWALCLRAVRDQWRRIALMQTNREDCGDRYREIVLPLPPSRKAAMNASSAFRSYFTTLAQARTQFIEEVTTESHRYIASVVGAPLPSEEDESEGNCQES